MIVFLKVMLIIILAYPLWIGLSLWLLATNEDQPLDEDSIVACTWVPVINIGIVIYLLMYKLTKKYDSNRS